MNQIVTKGIVLARTDFGEADRILTVLTPDHGKIRLMAKGVRRVKSKLAGGIELFSVSHITFIPGRKEIGTLVSTRLEVHFGAIINNIDRTMLGYELLKRINKATEDEPGGEYFTLLKTGLEALHNEVELPIVETWFDAQLLKIAGHQPNLQTNFQQQSLSVDGRYTFDHATMCFSVHENGVFSPEHIKVLRLLFQLHVPDKLGQVQDIMRYLQLIQPLVATLRKQYIPT